MNIDYLLVIRSKIAEAMARAGAGSASTINSYEPEMPDILK